MFISHVVAALRESDGGPSYSIPALVEALARKNCETHLHTIAHDPLQKRTIDAVRLTYHPSTGGPFGRALGVSSQLWRALCADARAGATIHTHGLWLMPNIYPAWAKRHSKSAAKLVHSPRGMLGREALKFSAWKKQLFWPLMQRSALQAADCIHATSLAEYDEVRAAGIIKPTAIIPNGIDLPALSPRTEARERTILALGRLHPKKGMDRLVRAWSAVEEEFPGWRLRIVGPPELNHDHQLKDIVRSLGVRRISIEGPIYGNAKHSVFREADIFVLPTLNENFGLTVAEALAAEVPVISTKGAPWSGLESEHCGWWIDHGVEPLSSTLRAAMSMPRTELTAMGQRGRAWMARDFSWDRVASDMLNVYRWLNFGGSAPPTIRLN